MKKIFFILSIFITINHNNAYANLDTFSCESLLTKNKTFIVYGKNFAKEEMSPNIWLFFQKIKLDKNNLNIISVGEENSVDVDFFDFEGKGLERYRADLNYFIRPDGYIVGIFKEINISVLEKYML